MITDEVILNQLKDIHGDKYAYTAIEPHGEFNKMITYTCNTCGDTNSQLLHNHLNGNGCRKCSYTQRGNRMRYTLEDITAIGKELHGEKYEYLELIEVPDKKNSRKIKYRCTICDTVNEQSIYRFIHGASCKRCSRRRGAALTNGKKKQITLSTVRKAGRSIYKKRYRYIKLEKHNGRSRPSVTFFCKQCNKEITQNVESHLLKNGCPECAKRIREKIRSSSSQSIINALKNIHKEYEFVNVVALNNRHQIVFKYPSCSMTRTQDAVALLQGRQCICSVKSISDLL